MNADINDNLLVQTRLPPSLLMARENLAGRFLISQSGKAQKREDKKVAAKSKISSIVFSMAVLLVFLILATGTIGDEENGVETPTSPDSPAEGEDNGGDTAEENGDVNPGSLPPSSSPRENNGQDRSVEEEQENEQSPGVAYFSQVLALHDEMTDALEELGLALLDVTEGRRNPEDIYPEIALLEEASGAFISLSPPPGYEPVQILLEESVSEFLLSTSWLKRDIEDGNEIPGPEVAEHMEAAVNYYNEGIDTLLYNPLGISMD